MILYTNINVLVVEASKEKEELMKRMNSYHGQIQKRACVRSTYECLMRSLDPTRSMHVDVEPRVFGQSESFQISVSPVDLMLLFTNKCLNSSIITLFATSINKILQQVKMQSNKCGFLKPYMIQDSVHIISKHWNLFIIVPQQNTGFILDSDMEGKNEESYEFTNVVQKLTQLYHSLISFRALGNMKWNLVECNQQRHYWESGYYVMRWMHQFVTHQQHSFPKTMPWNDKKPFTTKELDNIVSSCISPIVGDFDIPKIGNKYRTLDDCIKMYEEYAEKTGFSVRLSTQNSLKSGIVDRKYLVCNREGLAKGVNKDTMNEETSDNQIRTSSISRTGCMAKVKFKLNESHTEYVLISELSKLQTQDLTESAQILVNVMKKQTRAPELLAVIQNLKALPY
ncbi:FAR1 DNA binding domain-containing protein [Artemisia annua]|uniref:FAR1 DNA binding domain-containing protein n=1 Tax=Artemisia annua TaxID=35608 RepID=A0A2U1NX78_ARTAN|nr:FAR1 DNA binding domain-containing protein [Artemisia annua]